MKKTNTFKPIVIGTNDQEKQLHEANLSLILGYLNDFNEITDKYLPTFNKVSLKSNLFEAFKMQFQELHSGKFPELLSLDKILELSDVPTDKLRYLSQRIDELNKGILVNLATKKAPDKDFNIYTTSEDQNKLWKYLNEAASAIENLKQFRSIYVGQMTPFFNGLFQYDYSTQSLRPNIHVVQGKKEYATY